MSQKEVGVEIIAIVKLKGFQIIEIFFFIVACYHFCQFIGISIPLLLVIFTYVHTPIEIINCSIVAQRSG